MKDKYIPVALMVLLFCLIYSMPCNALDFEGQRAKEAELSNKMLRREAEIGKPDGAKINGLLSSHDFDAVGKIYDQYLVQYEKDAAYEWQLQVAYDIFSPDGSTRLETLDLWVTNTDSYIAYAARGAYKTKLGLFARGSRYMAQTPQKNLDEMEFWYREAIKDLRVAINKKPSLIYAYSSLMTIATTSRLHAKPAAIPG